MPDGRMLEEPGDAGRAKDAGKCRKSQEMPEERNAGRAWRCRKSLEMPEDA